MKTAYNDALHTLQLTEENMDMIASLLCIAVYQNVNDPRYSEVQKRIDDKLAAIHRARVNSRSRVNW